MFETIGHLNKIIELFITIITLGLFKDITNLLPKSSNLASLTLAWAIIIGRYAVIAFIIFVIANKYIRRYAIPATIITVVAIVMLTQPWITVNEIAGRFGGIDVVMKDYNLTRYYPSLLAVDIVNSTFNLVYSYIESLEKAVIVMKNATSIKAGVPHIENNTVTFRTVSFEWMFYLIALVAILLVFYILKHLNKYIAVLVVASLFAMFFFKISAKLIFVCTLILALILISWYVFKFVKVLVVYPIIIAIILMLSLIELPRSILFIILVVLMYISLLPVFYIIGIVVAEIGEIIERREKFGMKVKPKKIIEEKTGEWDKIAVALILSAVFLIAIVLFGANIYGIMTFIGMMMALFRS